MIGSGEQRRGRRVKAKGCCLRLLVEIPVRVREVSDGGALLEAPPVVAPGSEAQLRTHLHGRPFSPDVLVRRTVDPDPGAVRGQVAVTFDSMDEATRTSLVEFLKGAAKSAP